MICAAFDSDGDAAIAAVQDRLRELGVRVPKQPAHRLHITLAAVEAEPDDVAPVTARLARNHAPFEITLDRVGTFARGTILWLGPSHDEALYALQRATVDAVGNYPAAFGEQTHPRQWVPHCTLARRTRARNADQLRSEYESVTVGVDALATIVVGGRGDAALAPLTG